MIFKAFRVKSNEKFVENLLKARSAAVSNRKVKTVGVILHLDEFSDFEIFRKYFKSLNIRENMVKIVGYSKEETPLETMWDTYFHSKNFGWHGKIKNIDLIEFIDRDYDLLISYYRQDLLELNMITARSKANLKVGLADFDQRLYDLIIDVEPSNFELFGNELRKYLTVLNKV